LDSVKGYSTLHELYSSKGLNMAVLKAYEEVIDFIAEGTTPDSIIAFQPSEAAKQRVADLIRREKTTGLTVDETSELNHYMELEHLMRLAKARARKHIAKG
jgi:hypothetical protein